MLSIHAKLGIKDYDLCREGLRQVVLKIEECSARSAAQLISSLGGLCNREVTRNLVLPATCNAVFNHFARNLAVASEGDCFLALEGASKVRHVAFNLTSVYAVGLRFVDLTVT